MFCCPWYYLHSHLSAGDTRQAPAPLTGPRYNSAVFQSLESFDYTIGVVKDSFLDGASFSIEAAQQRAAEDWSFTDDNRINPPNDYGRVIEDMRSAALSSSSPYLRHNASSCFDYYDDYFIPQGNGLIFVKNESIQSIPDDSLLLWVSVIPRTDDWGKNLWALENGSFPTKGLLLSPSRPITQWFIGKPHYEVDYCLLQQTPWSEKKCQLQYSPWILGIVCLFNLTKLSTIFGIWITDRRARRSRDKLQREPLNTIGDAIQSFMRRPDPTTKGMCLATWRDFQKPLKLWVVPWKRKGRGSEDKQGPQEPREWREKRSRWRHATDSRQWIVFSLM